MKIPQVITLDFETEAIRRRPGYPPKPAGVAIRFPGERSGKYYAWGHPTKNNSTWEAGRAAVARAWHTEYPILCQHGKFDTDVAEVHFELPQLPWDRLHDTEYLLFLHNPHAKSLALKLNAELLLKMKPRERDELKDWILEHVSGALESNWGEFICLAPGDLVGRYAVSDLRMTDGLFTKLYADIDKRGMMAAYDRERRLMPILLATERKGLRANLKQMKIDLPIFLAARERAGNFVRKRLGVSDLDLGKAAQVGKALAEAGVVTDWTWTKGGKNVAPRRSVSKKTMTLDKFNDQQVAMAYGYYARMGTCINMFMENWIEMAEAGNGWLQPTHNQTRQDRGGDSVGTRSGRLSCDNPNLYNVSKSFENNKGDGYTHPIFLRGLPPLPLMRRYLLPDEDNCYWLHRDFNQQELRMTAHFEDGPLMKRYIAEPRFDIHSAVKAGLMEIAGLDLERDHVKIVNFSDLYGKGRSGLASELKVDLGTVDLIRKAKGQLMPGIEGLVAKLKARFAGGHPIRTWGGREYYCEEPSYSEKYGRWMTYEYKVLNYLIQPSSADYTKEAVIQYDEHPKRESRFTVTVYDEINASSPTTKGLSKKAVRDMLTREHLYLRESMETPPIDVPMLSDGKNGPNWADLVQFDKPEQPLERKMIAYA